MISSFCFIIGLAIILSVLNKKPIKTHEEEMCDIIAAAEESKYKEEEW